VNEYPSAKRTLPEMLERTVAERGDELAWVDGEREQTWSEFASEVEELAARLAALGVGAGDRVAMLYANGTAYTASVFAAWRLGAIAVPLNGRLLARELRVLVDDAEPAVVLVGPGFDEAAAELAPVRRDLDDVAAARPPAAVVEDSTPAAIMYTSGTTGRPKGVVVTHRNLTQNSRTCIDVIGRRAGDVELVMVPQFNITGLGSQTIPVVDAGMTGVLAPRFDTTLVLDLIERHRVTSSVGSPTMWWRLLDDETFAGRDLTSLRLVLYGGAPMPGALMERLRVAFPQASFGNGYGMTETCSMVTYIGGEEILARATSVGRPLPITELRVVDPETGEDVARGEVGELLFRGPQVSTGYWRNPDATAALFSDGWLRTGDAGLVDGDGFVELRDRLKDVVKRGGESIYCFEVENVLYEHPAVAEAAVVGVPDEVLGERVKAVVVAKPGEHVSADEVVEFCRERLARFKTPSVVEFRPELPRNAGGKVLKHLLKEDAAAAAAR
jgi:acyl-CoA synthetase (AMP-forming)/AMP-acid ligase II